MKYKISPTNTFEKDVKKAFNRGYDVKRLYSIINKSADGEILEEKYKDHALKGTYKGSWECHIAPDWLMIYKIYDDILVLTLSRTGSHSDLF
jgi:mRNA interferase YafQ